MPHFSNKEQRTRRYWLIVNCLYLLYNLHPWNIWQSTFIEVLLIIIAATISPGLLLVFSFRKRGTKYLTLILVLSCFALIASFLWMMFPKVFGNTILNERPSLMRFGVDATLSIFWLKLSFDLLKMNRRLKKSKEQAV